MALDRKCDKCGAPSASEVRVDILMMDVVNQGQPTGTSFVTDACPEHRDEECERLFRGALKQLQRDIPRHREIVALTEKEGALNMALKKAVGERDGIADKNSKAYRSAALVVESIAEEIQETQDRRAYVQDDKNYPGVG